MKDKNKALEEVKNQLINYHRHDIENKTVEELQKIHEETLGEPSNDNVKRRLALKLSKALAEKDMSKLLEPVELPENMLGNIQVDNTPVEYKGKDLAFPLPHVCPRNRGSRFACETIALSNVEIGEFFGFRKMKDKYRPQSNCKKCRKEQANIIEAGQRRYKQWKRDRDIALGYAHPDEPKV